MTWGTEQDPWPDRPDDEYPDFLWPDDDDAHDDDRPEAAGRPVAAGAGVAWGDPVPVQWAAPPVPAYAHNASERRRRILALSVTAVVAIGLGAGAVLAYRNAQAGPTPAAAASQGTGLEPGQSGGQAGQGTATEMELLGKVTAVGTGTITIGGGPIQSVRAAVTSATRFTGAVHALGSVRVGDTVAAQITIINGVAKVVSLQDPASDS